MAAQIARLERFSATRSVDLHCHCLPGLDDGPQSLDDSLALCRLLARDGITDVIATPHQFGRYDGMNWAAEIRESVHRLRVELDRAQIPLKVYPGAEVRVDERIPAFLRDDKALTLADQKEFLLLELPFALSVNVEAVRSLVGQWPTIVLAHAERYSMLQRDPAVAEGWVGAGIALQVNASSLVDDAPRDCRTAAMYWIEQGWVSLVATDAHSCNSRRPRMTDAIEVISREFGEEITRRICIENPARLLIGDPASGVTDPPR